MVPVIFVSHGSPMLAIADGAAHRWLKGFAKDLERPRAILVVSAHWETEAPTVSTVSRPETIYDFGGFAPALYQITYPAPGAPDLARRVVALLDEQGIACRQDSRRGLDHGAWVPLSLAYPDARIPVTQLSIQPHRDPAWHHAMGQALAPLREEGVLIFASGALTHNLRAFRGQPQDAPAEPWVTAFADWVRDKTESGQVPDLLNYEQAAPFSVQNHPTDEHFLPFFVALGASQEGRMQRIHASTTHAVLAMDAYQG